LEFAAKVFDEWHPRVDDVIDDLHIEVNKLATLKLEVGKISKYMERSMVDGPSVTPRVFMTVPATKSALAPTLPSASIHDAKPVLSPNFKSPSYNDFQAAPHPPARYAAWPNEHCIKIRNQQGEFRVVTI
jgi:hypothetical protein